MLEGVIDLLLVLVAEAGRFVLGFLVLLRELVQAILHSVPLVAVQLYPLGHAECLQADGGALLPSTLRELLLLHLNLSVLVLPVAVDKRLLVGRAVAGHDQVVCGGNSDAPIDVIYFALAAGYAAIED